MPEEGDPHEWGFLHGANWRVQYERFLEGKEDGCCLGDSKDENSHQMKVCFKVANWLLQSERSPHGEKTARDRHPSRLLEYDQHSRRPAVGYPRQNHTAKQPEKEKDLPK